MDERIIFFFSEITKTGDFNIYQDSLICFESGLAVMARHGKERFLFATGSAPLINELNGTTIGGIKKCPCDHANRQIINKHLNYTRPQAFGCEQPTFGFGDRLGVTTPAHITSIKNHSVKPILAQQSKREMSLTGRTLNDVLDDVVYGVLQTGYKGGFGADADHLKEAGDVEEALDLGVSMITLDCSNVLGNKNRKRVLNESLKDEYRSYKPVMESLGIKDRRHSLQEINNIYSDALDFIEYIYKNQIKGRPMPIDFEISLDETSEITSPLGHFFVANELRKRDVRITSIAPRFVGKFEKGVDYIGEVDDFRKDLRVHCNIAKYFGYKISLHSGSDKFSIFTAFSEEAEGRFHVKTSGTSWLEALRVISVKNPPLFNDIFNVSLEVFEKAKTYYDVGANLNEIEPIEKKDPANYVQYLNDRHARQCLHIGYGYVLADAEVNSRIYNTLLQNEEFFIETASKHLANHLEMLE